METKEIIVNRNNIWITIDPVVDKNELIGYNSYFNLEQPGLYLGESLKDEEDRPKLYPNSKEAEDSIIKVLQETLYPPFFLEPLEYNSENFSELYMKEVVVDLKGGLKI